jgi:hypothetical protein
MPAFAIDDKFGRNVVDLRVGIGSTRQFDATVSRATVQWVRNFAFFEYRRQTTMYSHS